MSAPTPPTYYLVAEGNAYALDDDGTPFGAPVFNDGTVDWSVCFDLDPCEEDLDYVAHIILNIQQINDLTVEHLNSEVFIK